MTQKESLISNLYFVRRFLHKALKSFQIRMFHCDLLILIHINDDRILKYMYKYKYELIGIVDRGKMGSEISSDFEIIIYNN